LKKPAKKRSHWLSNLLLLAGFALVVYGGAILGQARLEQAWASYVFERIVQGRPAAPAAVAVMPAPEQGEWLGRLEIPRLDVSVMVREGDDDSTLRIAAGHLPSSSLPGQAGTVAIAGHRDTFFRALRGIRNNDVIRLETHYGTHEYIVNEIRIVQPTQTEVLHSEGPTLSLITCYPFDYVGAAPQRFVVRAKESKETAAEAAESPALVSAGSPGPRKTEPH
jgi:sortase A